MYALDVLCRDVQFLSQVNIDEIMLANWDYRNSDILLLNASMNLQLKLSNEHKPLVPSLSFLAT
jgi:hypothetical protein